MNERLTPEWIEKVNQQFLEEGQKRASAYWKKQNNLPSTKRAQKKYAQSEKGKAARENVVRKRIARMKNVSPWWIERKMMIAFCKECPVGYEIDHILPLAKGGTHTLCNLQWIKKEVNQKKHTKILLKKGDFPQCVIKIRNGEF